MNELQKIIKYLSIAFAVFLTFNIIFGIIYSVSFIGNIFDNSSNNTIGNLKDLKIENDIQSLDIDVYTGDIIIKIGDSFKAETNNKYISSRQENDKFYIKEKKHSVFYGNAKNYLVIYVPSEFLVDSIDLKLGAGKISIESILVKKLNLDLGVGNLYINDMHILDNTKIDLGVGKVNINSSNINNLDLNIGVGDLSLNSKLNGNSIIDCGIGSLDLELVGSLDEYKILLDKGIGKAKLNGNVMNEDSYGIGNNKIDIEGGICSIDIDFVEQ